MHGKGLKYEPENKESLRKKEVAEVLGKRYCIVYFHFDSFNISEKYSKRLDRVGEQVRELGDGNFKEIMVAGQPCKLWPSSNNSVFH